MDLLSVLEVVKCQISLSISVVNQLARYTTHALDNVLWNPIVYRRNRMQTICSHKLLCCNLPGSSQLRIRWRNLEEHKVLM